MVKILRNISGKRLISILEKLGFVLQRQKGSHVFLKHPDGRSTVIPIHSNEDIGIGLLSKVIKTDLKMTIDEFEKHVK